MKMLHRTFVPLW